MRDIVRHLQESLRDRRAIAFCRLVETRGSTPQKAGAAMLVFPDGSQAGTLGGGCVEAEVKRRALAVLANGRAEIAKFQLDSDYGWDDGLICGGRMQVLLVPLGGESEAAYFRQLAELIERGAGHTEAVVFDPAACGTTAPASFLFDQDDRLVASLELAPDQALNPNDLERLGAVQDNLRPLATRPRPYAATGIGYLPASPRCRLIVVGGGHVGQAVAKLAADLEFDVWVVDDRPEIVSAERFPRAERRIAGDVEDVLPKLEITPDTYCLIVTRGHQHDEEALYHLADRGARYVGLIGSRRKIKMIFDDLLAEGISAEALSRVYAPLGIDIGSQTVAEIAVSICAELVSHRNRGGVVPGRPEAVPVQNESP
jgi:xanthine dehydrogenase accessory factor